MSGLFRAEVVESRRNKNYGSVSINTPVQYTVLTVGFSLLMSVVFLFLLLGEFSEKFIVKGYVESSKGIARIFPSRNGVITKCFVKQGSHVKRGEKLFLISSSDEQKYKKKITEILVQLEKKKKSLQEEMQSKQRQLEALKPLLDKKYIPLTIYHAKHAELVTLETQINSVEIDILNYKHNQSYIIRSPIDGVVSSVIYQQGQYTQLSKPMMKILPNHADLIAKLFIPIRQSGFLQKSNQVIIRYDAYPYTHYGTSKASIQEISKSSLTDDEEEKPIHIREPYYKVTAVLDKQFIRVYGKAKKIQQGMTISAVIVGSKRKIWQWIFDPLYNFYGGVFL